MGLNPLFKSLRGRIILCHANFNSVLTSFNITSMLIIIVGESLSEQHTDLHTLRICHAYAQVARYLRKLLSVWLHMHELSFTLFKYYHSIAYFIKMLNDNHVISYPHKFLALRYHCMYCSQTPPNLQSGPAQLAEAWKQGYNEQRYLIRKFSPCVCLHVEGV